MRKCQLRQLCFPGCSRCLHRREELRGPVPKHQAGPCRLLSGKLLPFHRQFWGQRLIHLQGSEIIDDDLCGGPDQGQSSFSSITGFNIKAVIYMGNPRYVHGAPYNGKQLWEVFCMSLQLIIVQLVLARPRVSLPGQLVRLAETTTPPSSLTAMPRTHTAATAATRRLTRVTVRSTASRRSPLSSPSSVRFRPTKMDELEGRVESGSSDRCIQDCIYVSVSEKLPRCQRSTAFTSHISSNALDDKVIKPYTNNFLMVLSRGSEVISPWPLSCLLSILYSLLPVYDASNSGFIVTTDVGQAHVLTIKIVVIQCSHPLPTLALRHFEHQQHFDNIEGAALDLK